VRKVISYALWGSHPKYCQGILRNEELARVLYPDWDLRVYIDGTIPASIHRELTIRKFEIELMAYSVGFLGMYWRMLPACDASIDMMICRDTDSRHNERERSAVREWEKSGKPFHIMRDHQAHSVPILGGMWGCRPAALPWFREAYEEWIAQVQPGAHSRGPFFYTDQIFLRGAVWPRVKDVCIAHDDAARYPGDVRPFPSPMIDGHFVGEVINAD